MQRILRFHDESRRRSRRERRVLAYLVMALTLVVAVSCSSNDEPPQAAKLETVPPGTVAGGSTVVVTTGPPVTFAASAPAGDVLSGLSDQIPLTDAEQACVISRLEADAALFERVRDGVAPGSPEYNDLVVVAGECRQRVTYADQFAQGVAQSRPTLTDEQRACVKDQFGKLGNDDLQALVTKVIAPSDTQPKAGEEVLNQMLAACHIDP